MANISAKEVNRLRKATGAGMMDCKKALVEAEGDFDKAIEILRIKGQKVSAKRADRDASEGAVFIATNDAGTEASLIQLNCETDFVARNEDFQNLGTTIVTLAQAEKPASIEALLALPLNGLTVGETLTEAIGRIGEKLEISSFEAIAGDAVVTYIHPGARIGVAVSFGKPEGDVEATGKDVAMQIAAMNPVAVNEEGVDPAIIAKEREIGLELARNEGKPEKILDRIADGKVKKFLKDNTLVNQEFVKDTSKTVAQYITDSLGKEATVVDFKRIQLGVK